MTNITPFLDNLPSDNDLSANQPPVGEPLKVQNQDDFKPLVEIKEPNLLNLVKFSNMDEKRRQTEWQSNYAPLVSEPANEQQKISSEHRQAQNKPLQASSTPELLFAMQEAIPLASNKLAKQTRKTNPNFSRSVPDKVTYPSPKRKCSGQRKKQRRLIIVLLTLSFLLILLIAGLCWWQYHRKPVEMNFQLRLQKYEKSLIAAARETGVWPSVTAAQLYIEAGDGPNKLADLDNNGFGLKWHDNMARRHRNAAWPVTYQTQEFIDGQYVTIDDLFGKFANFEIGLFEHDRIWWNGYHEEARKVLMDLENGKREDFIAGILHYATDPSYRAAIIKVIKEQKLDYLDTLAFPNGKRLRAGFADLQKKADEEALQTALEKLEEEKNKNKPKSDKEAPKIEKLKVQDLSAEQKQAALDEVKEKMYRSVGTYPQDGYNVSDLENENLQTALKR